MSKLQVKNDEIESDLKDETKEFAVFKKESKVRDKEMEEQVREQEKKLNKMERDHKGLAEHVSHKEMHATSAWTVEAFMWAKQALNEKLLPLRGLLQALCGI